jgi:hypothetical protein
VSYFEEDWQVVRSLCSEVHHGLSGFLFSRFGEISDVMICKAFNKPIWNTVLSLTSKACVQTWNIDSELFVFGEHVPKLFKVRRSQLVICINQTVEGAFNLEVKDI